MTSIFRLGKSPFAIRGLGVWDDGAAHPHWAKYRRSQLRRVWEPLLFDAVVSGLVGCHDAGAVVLIAAQ